jgi:Flp pilus assembly protein TadG
MKTLKNKSRALKQRDFRCRTGRRRGTVSLVVAIGMVLLLGMCTLAVDYGVISNDANQLQRAADAAALGGSQELTDTAKAEAAALNIAALNGVPDTSPNDVQVTFANLNKQITVKCIRTRPLFFARILGMNSRTLSREATASKLLVTPARIVPIGVTQATYDAMKANPAVPRVISYVRPTDTQYALDNFVVFDLRSSSAKSPSAMNSQLVNGAFNVKIGDVYTSLNASTGPVDQQFKNALATIFQSSAAAPWFDTWTGDVTTSVGIRYTQLNLGAAPYDNPRVMRLVVNPNSGTPTGGGTWDVPVLDFAPVYVEAYSEVLQPDGSTKRFITVRLLTIETGDSGSPTGLIK